MLVSFEQVRIGWKYYERLNKRINDVGQEILKQNGEEFVSVIDMVAYSFLCQIFDLNTQASFFVDNQSKSFNSILEDMANFKKLLEMLEQKVF